ncbi:MAG: TolC family outer membrane protein [Magnetococcales bacterium]|nr:TolC family outer membrane protein [Magnetococcales bacterium]
MYKTIRWLLALTSAVAAAPATAEDLMQVYALALQQDAGLAVAGEKKAMGMESVPQGLAALLPSAGLVGQYSHVSLQEPVNDHYRSRGYSLNLQMPLFRWDLIKGYEKAQKEEKKALVEYIAAEQDLVMRSARLYYEALLAVDTLQLALAEKEAMRQRLETTKASLEVGTAVMTDLHEAQAAFDVAETGVIQANNQHRSRFEALQEVTGQRLSSLAPLKQEIPLIKPDPDNVEEWVNKARADNISLRLAGLDKEIADDMAQAAWTGHLPAVDLMAAHGYSNSGALPQFQGGIMRSDSVTVQLSVPLFAGGGASSKVRQAKAAHSMSQQAEDGVLRQVVRQSRDAYWGLQSAIAQVQAMRQILVSSQSNLETTEAGYAAGIRTMVDVVASQRELFRAKRDYAQARYGYIFQSLGLKQVAGLLSSHDLQAINEWNQH